MKNMLVFLGAPGVGKTYFCAALIPWIFKKVPSFRYWNEREFLSRIRSSISGSIKGDYIGEIRHLLDYEFWMLDDLGSSGFNEWRREVLLDTIDERYESQLPTVITSNLTREEIKTGLGSRCYSRLFAKENMIIEMHDAPDLRNMEIKN